MMSLRNRLFPMVAAAFAISALAVVSCTSSNKTSTDTESTTTTTVVGGATTTTAASATTTHTTAPATTVKVTATTKPPTTNPPPTNPPTTAAPQIITSFSVSNASACPAPDVSIPVSQPSVTVSWTVVGADSVNLLIDGGLWSTYGLSGSESLPASCNSGHNVHSYSVVAIKNGQQIAKQSASRGS